MTSIEEELKDYLSKFPRTIAKSYNIVCGQCAYNIDELGLSVGEMCEGCNYQILTGRRGERFVARKHIDRLHELFRHDSMQDCHRAKTEMILGC